MTDKRKKIYIAIIVFCFSVSAGLLLYSLGVIGGGGSSAVPPDDNQITNIDEITAPRVSADGSPDGYSPPAVFPGNTQFDTTIFDSSEYKTLRPSQPITVNPNELGRENPFDNY